MVGEDPDDLNVVRWTPDVGGSVALPACMAGASEWTHVLDSVRERTRDSRWSVGLLLCLRGRFVHAALTTLRSNTKTLPDANLRRELEDGNPRLEVEDARDVMFLGGLAHLRGGFSFRPGSSDMDMSTMSSMLLASAWQDSTAVTVAALYVPEAQVQLVEQARPGFGQRREAPAVAVLPIASHLSSVDDFLGSLRRSARVNWLRDQRRFRAAGIHGTSTKMTPGLVEEAAPLVAAVKIRNGIFDHPRLTQLRLTAWVKDADPDSVWAWTCRDNGGHLVGVSFGILRDGFIRMVEIGLTESSPYRADLYLELEFHAPLRTSIDDGLAGIDLGSGHLAPKLHRGAVLRRQWHFFGRLDGKRDGPG
jgi:hypothetical protein